MPTDFAAARSKTTPARRPSDNDIFSGDNYAGTSGGAIDNQGTLTLTGERLTGNIASHIRWRHQQ